MNLLREPHPADALPNNVVFTFSNAGYSSDYVKFEAVEVADPTRNPLACLSKAQATLRAQHGRHFIRLHRRAVSCYRADGLAGWTLRPELERGGNRPCRSNEQAIPEHYAAG